jgi:hypothetical protein
VTDESYASKASEKLTYFKTFATPDSYQPEAILASGSSVLRQIPKQQDCSTVSKREIKQWQ